MRSQKSKSFWAGLLAGLLSCIFAFGVRLPNCFAQDIQFEVTVDKTTVSLGSSLQLNLNFYGTQDGTAPNLPEIDGFNWRYLGPSTRISVVNGKTSSSITHIYTLLPLKTGTFTIPSFSVEYKGKNYSSNSISVEVVQGQISQPPTRQGENYEEAVGSLEDKIFLVMEADKNTAYVNEIIPLTTKLYITQLPIRDIQYPEIKHQGFSVEKFSNYTQHQEVLNGVMYEVVEFNTNIFALNAGELKFGPAELKCNLIVKKSRQKSPSPFFDDDFFDNFLGVYEQYPLNLKSVGIPLTILEVPQVNKPFDFNGAIGDFQFYVEATPKEVNVGDPITLKVIISGKGNFQTVNMPFLNFSDNFKAYEPEIKQNETTKIFEQVIIPKNDKVKQIPETSFSFFNPATKQYETITKEPIAIKVNPLSLEEKPKILEAPEWKKEVTSETESLGKDIIYIKDIPCKFKKKGEFLYKNTVFILIQFVPFLAVIATIIFKKRKARIETDARYARRLRASRKVKRNLLKVQHFLAAEKATDFFDAVFKTLQEYIGDKFHLSTAGITTDTIEELKVRNLGEEILDKLKVCFNNCDIARYAPSAIKKQEMINTFELLQKIIDALERTKI